MKTLLLIRHAKSDWADMHARDFDRGLNDRGRKDAPLMAGYMAEEGFVPDAFVVSDACRAMQTATLMAAEFGISVDDIDWRHELYLASPRTLLAAI
ncbi:MAG: phosphoglycerate mutase, partial [Zetaproteobacteria bacterium CG02_land_8_20_14_3_00_50_9]